MADPSNSARRALILARYNILNTPPEAEFSDIARLAASVCETPVAAITFADHDRFWIKAAVGLNASTVPFDHTPCTVVLEMQAGVMVVEDAATDERIAVQRPAMLAQNQKFYAGTPLFSSEGVAIGTLCVFDRAPHSLAPEKAAALQALARQLMAMLELRRRSVVLHMGVVGTNAPSEIDVLTGLPNEKAFDRKLLAEGARAQRSGQELALLLLQFAKPASGEAGETPKTTAHTLSGAAQILAANARPHDYLARFDDDKLGLIMPGTNRTDAVMRAARLRLVLEDHLADPGASIRTGLSCLMSDSDNSSLVMGALIALHPEAAPVF